MKIADLHDIQSFEKVRIHSLESNLYQLSVVIDGQEHYLHDQRGELLKSHNKLELQQLFEGKQVEQMVLCHQSAYDEMVGQPVGEGNTLEVPLGNPWH
ncbi:hypothetical protein JQX58_09580 [Marinomonas ostreistagni]|nr:hypothetical protein [Marinomonas ostreistagni]